MTRSERECLQKRIVQFYVNIAGKKKKLTVNHFLTEKIPRRTIYNIIKNYKEGATVGGKPRSGRPKKLCSGQLTRLKHLVNHKTDVSLRRLGSEFLVSHETIRTYFEEMNISYYKKQRAPSYTDQQLNEVPTRARRLYRMLSNNVKLLTKRDI
jgi:transposase